MNANNDLLDELNELDKDPIDKLKDELEGMDERLQKFQAIIAKFIRSTSEEFKSIRTSLEILQNKSVNVDASTNSQVNKDGGTGIQGKVDEIDQS